MLAASTIKDLCHMHKSSEWQPIGKPELFVGLAGPVGVDTEGVVQELVWAFEKIGYYPIKIKLSEILKNIEGLATTIEEHDGEYARITSLMNRGTEFREKMKNGNAVAVAGISRVREERQRIRRKSGEKGKDLWRRPVESTVYIFDSLKHRSEAETLRHAYGSAFLLISVYSPEEKRRDALAERIARSKGVKITEDIKDQAGSLIKRDLAEENKSLGQDMQGVFPLADLFVRDEDKSVLSASIMRFVEILFDHPFHTPTKDEFGMFQAKAVALRSADLSRQVGAAVMTKDGCLISLGCNEVPRAGGGFYWPEDKNDARDCRLGTDANALMKSKMWEEAIDVLKLVVTIDQDTKKLADQILYKQDQEETAEEERIRNAAKNATLSNILEFGRIVHAEMAAITDAARRGLSVQDAILYCTTFPCHICARHIIASGVAKVVYIEPYPKSKTADLYGDSVLLDTETPDSDKVAFKPFIGVSPLRYIEFFSSLPKSRKDERGVAVQWSEESAQPKIKVFVPSYIFVEDQFIDWWQENLSKKNLSIN
jgi:deoxycytidylate deaminase